MMQFISTQSTQKEMHSINLKQRRRHPENAVKDIDLKKFFIPYQKSLLSELVFNRQSVINFNNLSQTLASIRFPQ